MPLRESALAGTAMRQLVEDIQEKMIALDNVRTELSRVEALRGEILERTRLLDALQPQLGPAQQRLREQRQKRTLQDQCDRALLDTQRIAAELEIKRNELDARITGLRELRKREGELQSGCEQLERDLLAAARRLDDLERGRRDAERARIAKEVQLQDAQRQREAISLQRETVRQREAIGTIRSQLDRLSKLEAEAAAAKEAALRIGPWPEGEEIGAWRKMHSQLIALETEARSKLQLDIRSQRPIQLSWSPDMGATQSTELATGESCTVGAVRSLRLTIDDVCEVDVRCGADELGDLLKAIEADTKEIDEAISEFGVTAMDLTKGGFDRLEELRIHGEAAQRRAEAGEHALAQAREEFGSPEKLKAALTEAEGVILGCQTKLRVLGLAAPADAYHRDLATALDTQSELVRQHQNERDRLGQQLESLANQLKDHAVATSRMETKLEHSRAELIRVRGNIQSILSNGATEASFQSASNAVTLDVARAHDDVRHAKEARDAHGTPITDEELHDLETTFKDLQKKIENIHKELVERRAELRTRCGNDPEGRVDELDVQIRQAQMTLLKEERRLAALLFLDYVLGAERKRIAKLVSQPLNQRISPWLSQIRGARTEVVLDEGDGKIASVTTYLDAKRIELPFDELSSGLKGQLAFLVRLTLAAAMAREKGSRDFVILDDPLTDTGPERRPEMFRLLRHASEELQILFVTCHEDVVATLPGVANVLKA